MNRTKNTIGWCDWSWNPITGCLEGCWYCYGRKMSKRFKKIFPRGYKPTFYPDRLTEPSKRKKPAKIFVCSISDLFASWIPAMWRNWVLSYARNCPVLHTFQFLTRSPELIPKRLYPDNFWMGATVTCENGDWKRIEAIKKVHAGVRFVSFEPLLGMLPIDVSLEGLDWVIIGKLTGSKKVKLNSNWVCRILWKAEEYGIPVFMKNNLKPEYQGELIQEFPK